MSEQEEGKSESTFVSLLKKKEARNNEKKRASFLSFSLSLSQSHSLHDKKNNRAGTTIKKSFLCSPPILCLFPFLSLSSVTTRSYSNALPR
jgi:hypothetical protein